LPGEDDSSAFVEAASVSRPNGPTGALIAVNASPSLVSTGEATFSDQGSVLREITSVSTRPSGV
jgi:hypothetical protein